MSLYLHRVDTSVNLVEQSRVYINSVRADAALDLFFFSLVCSVIERRHTARICLNADACRLNSRYHPFDMYIPVFIHYVVFSPEKPCITVLIPCSPGPRLP
jgi:hypothetical protein